MDELLPPLCLLCGAPSASGTCPEHALPERPAAPRCGRCDGPLPPALPDGARCRGCRAGELGLARVLALGDYRADDPLRELILAFKHGGRRELAQPLGALLAARWSAAASNGPARTRQGPPLPPLLVPVPLHSLRRLERGYDQAWLLSRCAGDALGLPAVRLLARRRYTPAQGSALARSRAANVAGAFAVRPRCARSLLPGLDGRRVWLVDDVVTSGATLAECARELRRAGAARVGALVLAHAGRLGTSDADGR